MKKRLCIFDVWLTAYSSDVSTKIDYDKDGRKTEYPIAKVHAAMRCKWMCIKWCAVEDAFSFKNEIEHRCFDVKDGRGAIGGVSVDAPAWAALVRVRSVDVKNIFGSKLVFRSDHA